MNNAQRDLENCSFAKTILMMVIVLYHSMLFFGGRWFSTDPVYPSAGLAYLAKWMNSFHIYSFTLISGYIFYAKKFEQDGYSKYLPFISNKSKRLLTPYIVISAVWALPIYVLFFGGSAWEAVRQSVLDPTITQLWFLLMLFNVFILFWPLSNFFSKHTYSGGILALLFYGASVIGSAFYPNVLMIWTTFAHVPLFWLGFKLRQYGGGIFKKIPAWIYLPVDVLLFIFNQSVAQSEELILKLLSVGSTFALHIIGALMAFYILQKAANKLGGKNKAVTAIGNRSMLVYLFHQQIIYFFCISLNGLMNPYLHTLVNFVGSFAISFLIAEFVMKFKITRVLTGEDHKRISPSPQR